MRCLRPRQRRGDVGSRERRQPPSRRRRHAALVLSPTSKKGWLAVVGRGRDGRFGFYSHYYGDAGDWCIAAPGELVTTHRDGRWTFAGGASIAALRRGRPGCAEGKGMFPHLTYRQIRACILDTADRSPPYASTGTVGSTLMPPRVVVDSATRALPAARATAPAIAAAAPPAECR